MDLVRKHGAQGVVLHHPHGQTTVTDTLRLLSEHVPAVPRFVMAGPDDRDSLRRGTPAESPCL